MRSSLNNVAQALDTEVTPSGIERPTDMRTYLSTARNFIHAFGLEYFSLRSTPGRSDNTFGDAGAFRLVDSFCNRYDSSNLEWRARDLIHILTDPMLAPIRTCLCYKYLSDVIEYGMPEDIRSKSPLLVTMIIQHSRSNQFRYFTGSSYEKSELSSITELVRNDPDRALPIIDFVIERMKGVLNELEREGGVDDFYSDLTDAEQREWSSDPGHGSAAFRWIDYLQEIVHPPDAERGGLRATVRKLECRAYPLSLLIIDDDPDQAIWLGPATASGTMTRFEDSGFMGSTAEALSVLPNLPRLPDVLLVDVEFGESIDGVHLAQSLRQLAEQRGEAPIILVHSSRIAAYRNRLNPLVDSGAIQGFFPKLVGGVIEFIAGQFLDDAGAIDLTIRPEKMRN